MKSDIHATIFPKAKVTCTSCKAVFVIPGTQEEIQIEICSNCHPVYTGKYRGAISSDQVDKFKKKLASAKESKKESKTQKRKVAAGEKMRKKMEDAKKEKEAKKTEQEIKKREKLVKEAKKVIKKAATRTTSEKSAKRSKKKK